MLTHNFEGHTYPWAVRFEGRRYSMTGKTGHNVATGNPSVEYADENDDRVWMNLVTREVARD